MGRPWVETKFGNSFGKIMYVIKRITGCYACLRNAGVVGSNPIGGTITSSDKFERFLLDVGYSRRKTRKRGGNKINDGVSVTLLTVCLMTARNRFHEEVIIKRMFWLRPVRLPLPPP